MELRDEGGSQRAKKTLDGLGLVAKRLNLR
jgi:hypothetical protein